MFLHSMEWGELARAIIQDIYEKQGGIVVFLALYGLTSTAITIIALLGSWHILNKKQEELDRKSEQTKKLEEQILKNRRSSEAKSKHS